jgi:hypothetical protein
MIYGRAGDFVRPTAGNVTASLSLAAQNLRTIRLTDPEHVERYGLEQFAAEHGEPGPQAANAA